MTGPQSRCQANHHSYEQKQNTMKDPLPNGYDDWRTRSQDDQDDMDNRWHDHIEREEQRACYMADQDDGGDEADDEDREDEGDE